MADNNSDNPRKPKTIHQVVWGGEDETRVVQQAVPDTTPNPDPTPEPEPDPEPTPAPAAEAAPEPLPVSPPHTAALPPSIPQARLAAPIATGPAMVTPPPAAPAPPIITPAPAPAPAPAPVSASPRESFTPPTEQSRALAQTVVSAFVGRLSAEARRLGGYLTTRDIDRLSNEFKDKTDELQTVFQASFDQYVRARERAAVDHARQYPFDRIIVNTFAHLFEPERVADDGEFAVTRKVLPGFFLALDKMLGEDNIAAYQERAKAIIDRLSPNGEVDVDWEMVYADSVAHDLCLDALVSMAPYFQEYERRMDWFMRLVNSDLTDEDKWLLADWGFYNLVEALFAPLRAVLADAAKRPALEERYGGVTCFNIDKMLETLDKIGARED